MTNRTEAQREAERRYDERRPERLRVSLTVTGEELEQLDLVRGDLTREQYVEQWIRPALRAALRQGLGLLPESAAK